MTRATYWEFDALTRQYFALFVQRVFAEVNPGAPYLDNFHIHMIVDELEAMRRGDNRHLAVAMPPRSLKSVIISVAWPAWLLGHNPRQKILCVSYSQDLAEKLASDCRQVMQSQWYRRLFPRTQLRQGRQQLTHFETTEGGYRMSVSAGGAITGFGADWIIIDDPIKPSDALSETERANAQNLVQNTLLTRLNDKRHGRIVMVMQRLHEEDPIGSLERQAPGMFRQMAFPAIAQGEEHHAFTLYGWPVEHVRREGEALHPEREPIAILEEQRRLLGSAFFSAQYLQDPLPSRGHIVRGDWFRRYQPYEVVHRERVIQSWDTASKAGEHNDYSVCTTWLIRGKALYLLDVVRARLEFPDLKRRVIAESDRWKPDWVLIEDMGSGQSLLQELSASGFGKSKAVKPDKNKVIRLAGVSAIIEEGRVFLPDDAHWLPAYLAEMTGFPNARHDDQVDSTSQALAWIRDQGNPGGLFFFYELEHAALLARQTHRTMHLRAPSGISHAMMRDGTRTPIASDGTVWVTEADMGPLLRAGFVPLNWPVVQE